VPKPKRLLDQKIRSVLRKSILRRRVDTALVLDEVGLLHGETRIDLLVASRYLHGYEIKGETDDLGRLPDQAEVYSRVCDRVSIVLTRNHLERASKLVPGWWGITVAETGPRAVRLVPHRKAVRNPSPDILALSMLLWRAEAYEYLESIGASEGLSGKPRSDLYERIAQRGSFPEIRKRVIERFRKRWDWAGKHLKKVTAS